MKKLLLVSVLVVGSSSATAFAQDLEEGGQLFAIQNRKYVVSHEFTLGLGIVPLDAFYKGYTGTFAYTYHFDDLWGWEIVSASYSLNVDTSLREDLERDFGVQPTEFPELTAFGSSNVVIKPLYGKMVYLNETLLYGELFLTGGPAVANYENGGWFIGLNAGIGGRLFLSRSFALRLDLRTYEYIDAASFDEFRNELLIQFGLGLNIQ